MQCKKEENLKKCNCTYSCDKKGICCECKSGKMDTKWLDVANFWCYVKNELNIKEVIYFSPKITNFGKKILKENGILGFKDEELERYLDGK